jgi:hypothetical protein
VVVLKLGVAGVGIVWMDVLRRMCTACSHVVYVAPLLHLDEAREMGQTEVTTIDVGRRDKVCWVTDVPGFVETSSSQCLTRETERREVGLLRENPAAQGCQLVSTYRYLGLQVVGSGERQKYAVCHIKESLLLLIRESRLPRLLRKDPTAQSCHLVTTRQGRFGIFRCGHCLQVTDKCARELIRPLANDHRRVVCA